MFYDLHWDNRSGSGHTRSRTVEQAIAATAEATVELKLGIISELFKKVSNLP